MSKDYEKLIDQVANEMDGMSDKEFNDHMDKADKCLDELAHQAERMRNAREEGLRAKLHLAASAPAPAPLPRAGGSPACGRAASSLPAGSPKHPSRYP